MDVEEGEVVGGEMASIDTESLIALVLRVLEEGDIPKLSGMGSILIEIQWYN